MKTYRHALLLGFAAAMTFTPALAQEEDACTAPGILVMEDASGDTAVVTAGGPVPVPATFMDIESLHMSEAIPGKLVFTYKIADLASPPPTGAGWILRFSTETLPANGDTDYFVAMFATSAGMRFVHGTNGFTADAPAEPRQFRIAGDLSEESGYNADGTITLVLDRAAIPDLNPGQEIFSILPTTRVMVVPAEDGLPFATNSQNETIIDDVPGSGFYELTEDNCGGEKSLFGISVGGLPVLTLALLTLAGMAGLRRKA